MNIPAIMQKVKNAFKRKGVKQKTVAQDIGVHDSTISNWFNGKIDPSFEDMLKLIDMAGLELTVVDPAAEKEPAEQKPEKISNRDLRRNGSGYYDPTAYEAITHVEGKCHETAEERERRNAVIGCILRICELSGYTLDSKIILKKIGGKR